jgi:hypothetical protein
MDFHGQPNLLIGIWNLVQLVPCHRNSVNGRNEPSLRFGSGRHNAGPTNDELSIEAEPRLYDVDSGGHFCSGRRNGVTIKLL